MNQAHEAALALHKAIADVMPRIGYARTDGRIPQMGGMVPVRHVDTGEAGFLLLDAADRADSTYTVPMMVGPSTVAALANEGTGVGGFMTSAVQCYHAEWN